MEILGRLEAWKAEMENEKKPFEKFMKNMERLDLKPILLLADQRFKSKTTNGIDHIPHILFKPKCQASDQATEPIFYSIRNTSEKVFKMEWETDIKKIESDEDGQLHEKSLPSEREAETSDSFSKCTETLSEVSFDDSFELSLSDGEQGCSNDENDVVVIEIELDPVDWSPRGEQDGEEQATIPVSMTQVEQVHGELVVVQAPRSFAEGHQDNDVERMELDVITLKIFTPQDNTSLQSAKSKNNTSSLVGQEQKLTYLEDNNQLPQPRTSQCGDNSQGFPKEAQSSLLSESSHLVKQSVKAALTDHVRVKSQASYSPSFQTGDTTLGSPVAQIHEHSANNGNSFTQLHHIQTKTTMDLVKVEPSHLASKQNDEEQSNQEGNSKHRPPTDTQQPSTSYQLLQDLPSARIFTDISEEPNSNSITRECTFISNQLGATHLYNNNCAYKQAAHGMTQSLKTYSKQTPLLIRGLKQYGTEYGACTEATPPTETASRPKSCCLKTESECLCSKMDPYKSKHVMKYEEGSQQLCGREENLHSPSVRVAQTYAADSEQVQPSREHSLPHEYVHAIQERPHGHARLDRNDCAHRATTHETASGPMWTPRCQHSIQPCNNAESLYNVHAHECGPCAPVSSCRHKPSCQHISRSCHLYPTTYHHCCGANTNACVYASQTDPCTIHGARHTQFYRDTDTEDYLPVKRYKTRVCDHEDRDVQSRYHSLQRAYQEAMSECNYMYEQAHRYQRERHLWETANLPCNRRKRKQTFQVRDYEECTVREDPHDVLYI